MPGVVEWEVVWTNPAGSADGDVVVAQIKTDPKRPGVPAVTVPKGYVYVVKDIFKKNVSIGGRIEIIVNDMEVVYRSPDVLTFDPANPSRPMPPDIILYEGDTVKINVYVNANGGTNAVTESLTFVVEVHPA